MKRGTQLSKTGTSTRFERVTAYRATAGEVLVLSIPRDTDLHDGIISACIDAGIRDAVLVEGHATLDPVALHRVTSTAFPIVEGYETLDGPWELVSLGGLLVNGELHAHAAVADEHRTAGGHLHSGSRVLYLAEIVVIALDFHRKVTRKHEARTNLWLLESSDDAGQRDSK